MQIGSFGRLLVVATLAAAFLAGVAVLAPGSGTVVEPGISTTSTIPGDERSVTLPDPCSLVTRADTEAAMGRTVEARPAAGSSCIYASTGGDGAPEVTVRIDVRHAPDGIADLEREREDAMRAIGVAVVTDIEGLGDAAFLATGDDIALLRVVSGEVGLVIGIAGPVDDASRIATDLAASAKERM